MQTFDALNVPQVYCGALGATASLCHVATASRESQFFNANKSVISDIIELNFAQSIGIYNTI